MSGSSNLSVALGDFGETEVRNQLERATSGTANRLQGSSDKGLDLILQIPPWTKDGAVAHVPIQVKTGASYAEEKKRRWRVKGIDPVRFKQWTKSQPPVLFVWVRPTNPPETYWGLVTHRSELGRFSLSSRARISPAIRFELLVRVSAQAEQVGTSGWPLPSPIHVPLRVYGKNFYKSTLFGRTLLHPAIGEVTFTQHAWRHITSQSRRQGAIRRSIELLPFVASAVAAGGRLLGIRRVNVRRRGTWTTETRKLIYDLTPVEVKHRGRIRLRTVFQEQVIYPADWFSDPYLWSKVTRRVTFESVYARSID